MKCPKCGYLGFERVERCRNCGYEFSLTATPDLPELPIRTERVDEGSPFGDLSLVDAAVSASPSPSEEFTEGLDSVVVSARPTRRSAPNGLPFDDDAPLITRPSPPRPPLSVRRATPEVPRLRTATAPRMAMLDLEPDAPGVSSAAREQPDGWAGEHSQGIDPEPAPLLARSAAAAIDIVILSVIDLAVIYFTMQICGLKFEDFSVVPKGPLLAFLAVQNGGYLVALTAGGQTLGKMAAGIKVVTAGADAPLDLGHSILRTLVWVVLAVPAGLGFLTALFGHEHRGLHDRFAGTRVVRATL
jgi:uncharacterized RDD family membrane protein YckC